MSLISDDCCLLTNIDLNSQRIYQLLEKRFKSNSYKTSFDFKSFHPEQPSNNTKVTRSFLRFKPKLIFTNDYEENISSDSSSSEDENNDENVLSTNDDDDDNDEYLNTLAEWEPKKFQPIIQTDDDDDDDDGDDDNENIFQSMNTENNNEISQINQMEHSPAEDNPSSLVEDLLITFIHRPVKTEPISFDNKHFSNPPQLDGHIDMTSNTSSTPSKQCNINKNLDAVIAKVRANTATPNKAIQLRQIPLLQNKKICLSNDRKKQTTTTITTTPTNKISKKKISNLPKIHRIKEQTSREIKQIKKIKTPSLLSTLLKSNEDAIRPFETPTQINNHKPSRLLSDNGLQSTSSKQQNRIKTSGSLLNNERNFSSFNNQKSHTQNQQNLLQTKEKSASDYMTLTQRKLNQFQKHQQLKTSDINLSPILLPKASKSKENTKISTKLSTSIDLLSLIPKSTSSTSTSNDHNQQIKKKIKRLDNVQSTSQLQTKHKLSLKNQKQKSEEHYVIKKQKQVNKQQSESSIDKININDKNQKRPSDFFHGCIVIDDDDDDNEQQTNTKDNDIQEIERQYHSIAHDIRTREKLLDHAVHSSIMHIKWLVNLEYLLHEHILICHENNIRPLNKIYENTIQIKCEPSINKLFYNIDPSFISIIIINFIKMFILRNTFNDQQEVSFIQIGITSHLRYLLIELPTYNHNDEKEYHDDCFKCHQYSLIINILFDLLFDLIEYDLCEINSKIKYRSSLIEDDYFTRFLQSKIRKKNPFYRIKLIIYFIELIGIHMNKCQSKKQFQFNKNENKLFQSIEDFIRNLISQKTNLIHEKISICFNIMELCLLFVSEKDIRIKQMSLFLLELCENDSSYINLFIFDKNLFIDIRLLLINELISKKFRLKFISIHHINEFFQQIQNIFNSSNPIDELVLLLIRCLFSTYADLIIEIKTFPSMYSNFNQQLKLLLQNQLNLIYTKLIEISSKNLTVFQQIKRTLLFYRLLICKWNTL